MTPSTPDSQKSQHSATRPSDSPVPAAPDAATGNRRTRQPGPADLRPDRSASGFTLRIPSASAGRVGHAPRNAPMTPGHIAQGARLRTIPCHRSNPPILTVGATFTPAQRLSPQRLKALSISPALSRSTSRYTHAYGLSSLLHPPRHHLFYIIFFPTPSRNGS